MKYRKAGELVVVSWHDAYAHAGWRSKEALHDLHEGKCEVRSIGEVFRHDKKGITLINGLDNDTIQFSGYHHVPGAYIQKIELISKKKYWSQK